MIKVDSVYLKYNSKTILNNIQTELLESTITSIIGPAGSGKTALLKILAGRLNKTDGKIESNKTSIQKNRTSFFPPEEIKHDSTMTLREFMFLNIKQKQSFDNERFIKLSKFIKIDSYLQTPISNVHTSVITLALILGVILKPSDLYLLDNPTAQLDPLQKVQLIQFLKNICRSNPAPIVISTNDINFALACSNRYIALKRGKVFSEGKTRSLDGKQIEFIYQTPLFFQRNPVTGNGECSFYHQV
jgi:ABC-type cobalamin/Fe3+-siderophores transport system ATPase subunit